MTIETVVLVLGLAMSSVVGFLGWLIRQRFVKLDEVDQRLTVVETKFDVLGDISTTLHHLRTDVEVIKAWANKQQ